MRIELILPKDQELIEEALSIGRDIKVKNAGIQSDYGMPRPSVREEVLAVLRGDFQGRDASVNAMDMEKTTAWAVSQFLTIDGHTRWQIHAFETDESIKDIKRRLRIKKEARALESVALVPEESEYAPISGRKRL
jgi:hypothetical protein